MKTLLLLFIVFSGIIVFGQEQVNNSHPVAAESIYTSVKPVDASPVVFANQEELDSKKADKIEKIKGLIQEHQNNPNELLRLREELWRFENATVKESTN